MERFRHFFWNLAIRSKLRMATVCISLLVVLVTAGTLIVSEVRSFRKEMIHDLQAHADVISNAVRQLPSPVDTATMAQILSSMAVETPIAEAHILSRDGKLLASFYRDQAPGNAAPDIFDIREEYRFTPDTLEVKRGIQNGTDIQGFVYLKSDLSKLYARLVRYYQISAMVLVGVVALALVLSSFIERFLSAPIVRLSSAARHIAHTKRYDMRVPKTGGDEIGVLVDAFNDMVEQTARQTAELSKANHIQEKLIGELRQAKEGAERAHESKSQFLARISHEIRTPVNGVLGMVDLLLDSPLEEQQKRLATTVKNSGHTLLEILNELLDYAKIEANRIELEITEYDLHNMADGIVEILGQTAFGKGIEIGCAVDPRIPPNLLGDPLRLRQILINLVGNAVKFTKSGEVGLTVTLEGQGDRDVQLRFEVQDTGVGIPLEAQRKIFEAFAQADEGTSRKFGGTGLGLSIAKQLVNLMGGDLYVQSQEGAGSRFFFSIRQPMAERQPDIPALPETLRNCNVLIVDHSPIGVRSLQNRLSLLGARLSVVRDAHSALELAEGQSGIGMPFDMIIISSRLGDFTAEEFCRALGKLSCRKPAVIVAAPICDQAPLNPLVRSMGISLLDKPVQLARLCQVMAGTIDAPDTRLATEKGTGDALATPPPPPKAADPLLAPVAVAPVAPPEALPVLGHILVAEDNPVNAEVTRGMLASRQFLATVAVDGLETFKAYQEHRYDMILMDGQMPNMDGLEATIAIRAYEQQHNLPAIPIIACTANIVDGLREEYLSKGMNDFISKPFSRDQLIWMVQRWLPERNTARKEDVPAAVTALPAATPAIPETHPVAASPALPVLQKYTDTATVPEPVAAPVPAVQEKGYPLAEEAAPSSLQTASAEKLPAASPSSPSLPAVPDTDDQDMAAGSISQPSPAMAETSAIQHRLMVMRQQVERNISAAAAEGEEDAEDLMDDTPLSPPPAPVSPEDDSDDDEEAFRAMLMPPRPAMLPPSVVPEQEFDVTKADDIPFRRPVASPVPVRHITSVPPASGITAEQAFPVLPPALPSPSLVPVPPKVTPPMPVPPYPPAASILPAAAQRRPAMPAAAMPRGVRLPVGGIQGAAMPLAHPAPASLVNTPPGNASMIMGVASPVPEVTSAQPAQAAGSVARKRNSLMGGLNDPIDSNILKNIVNLDPENGAEFLNNLITIYLQDTQYSLEQMHRAVNRLDFDSLKKLAHKVKSSSANIGAVRLSQHAQTIETNPASSDIDDRLQALKNEYDTVQEALSNLDVEALG